MSQTYITRNAACLFACLLVPIVSAAAQTASESTSYFAGTGAGARSNDANNATDFGGNQYPNGRNTFIGVNSGQSVDGADNVALGFNTGLDVTGSGNTAAGASAGQNVTGFNNNAFGVGAGSQLSGDSNVAVGDNAGSNITGGGNVAIGFDAGNGDVVSPFQINQTVAVGYNSTASALQAVAIGAESTALGAGSVAIGAHATATLQGQFALGTSANTYTLAGIDSDTSRNRQESSVGSPTGVLQIVTSDDGGNLAVRSVDFASLSVGGDPQLIAALQTENASQTSAIGGLTSRVSAQESTLNDTVTQVEQNRFAIYENAQAIAGFNRRADQLAERDDELAQGIAIAMAMQQPIFHPGNRFAIRIGYGNFDDANAMSATVAGVIARGFDGNPSSVVTLDAGVGLGLEQAELGARGGVTFGW